MRTNIIKLILGLTFVSMTSCEKLVDIGKPIDTITTTQIFSTDDQALNAMAGIYSTMINAGNGTGQLVTQWSLGLTTLLGGLSADELDCVNSFNSPSQYDFNRNNLRGEKEYPENSFFWNTAFNTIYGANAVIEGVSASVSSKLTDPVRKKILAEARFLRAFSYFYLTNFYGDLPLVLTVDFNETRNLPRVPQRQIYDLIVKDLLGAQSDLPLVNTSVGGERIYPDKWAATAMLARVYLYQKEYEKAYQQASAVIDNRLQFALEPPARVFIAESREAIWQLKQSFERIGITGTATSEGNTMIPESLGGVSQFSYFINPALMNAFENNDHRKLLWTGNAVPVGKTALYPYPAKYKVSPKDPNSGSLPVEYYMMLRIAEQYLIRAEAAAHGAAALSVAIGDLNLLRSRVGLDDHPDDLSQKAVIAAVAQERRIELCFEWGHRWFDLKRTGQATVVLPLIPSKQPWSGDHQLLYPIPPYDLRSNPNLSPNPGY